MNYTLEHLQSRCGRDGRWGAVGAGLRAAAVLLIALNSTALPQSEIGVGARNVKRAAIAFQENAGQWPSVIRFVARTDDIVARVEETGIAFELRSSGAQGSSSGVLVRIEVESRGDSMPEGEQELLGRHHYCSGSDSEWIRNVRTFARVRVPCVVDGIDWVLREHEGGLEYDLELAANADLDAFSMRCLGQEALSVEEDGSLLIHTRAGVLRQRPPVSREKSELGEWHDIDVRFRLLSHNRFGFLAPGRDRSLELHIDPGVEWATYLGGQDTSGGTESVVAVRRHSTGDLIVAGDTGSPNFPVTPGAFATPSLSGRSFFVSRLNPSGNLVYSTHIAPTFASCSLHALAVDSQGRATIGGEIYGTVGQTSFPTTPQAFDITLAYGSAAYVMRLTAQGDGLEFSTLLNAAGGGCAVYSLAIAASGATVAGGWAGSALFPTSSGAYDTTFNASGSYDGFIARIAPDGSYLEWSTFLGGGSVDQVRQVALDATENVTVAGLTSSSDFPTTPGTLHNSFAGFFVARLNSRGSGLVWSARISPPFPADDTYPEGMSLGRDGSVLVVGATKSLGFFTTPGALFQAPTPGVNDFTGYFFKLDPTGSSLIYASYLSVRTLALGVSLDVSGVATIVGGDFRSTMPLTPGAPTGGGVVDGTDAMIVRLDPTGTKLYYSARVGSPGAGSVGFDVGVCTTPIDDHHIVLGGHTTGSFPVTSGAFDTTFNGGLSDGFVAVVDMVFPGVTVLGAPTPACLGSIGMNTTQMPTAGSPGFGFWCSGAPPNSTGWLILGSAASTPIVRQGATLWLDPSKRIIARPVSSDAAGFVETSAPLTGLQAGLTFAAQYVFRNTSSCSGAGVFSASNALRIQLQ